VNAEWRGKRYYLAVGDKVTSEYTQANADVIRTITAITPWTRCSSGAIASADGGQPCPTCKRHAASPIEDVDAGWFEPVNPVVNKKTRKR